MSSGTGTTSPLRDVGPDGEKIVDMSYYELLGVNGDAGDVEIKKAYRKAAIRWHPDKNPGNPDAQAKFQEISEAYTVLSDSNSRAVYNTKGKKTGDAAEEAMDVDPAQMFTMMFGGEAFHPWIGELSMGKDLNMAYENATTDEEKDAMRQEMNQTEEAGEGAAREQEGTDQDKTKTGDETPEDSAAAAESSSSPHLTEKQRERMRQYERERIEEKVRRIKSLASELTNRIRPLVEARDIENPEDPDVKRFVDLMHDEINDLAVQSFGVELCHLIGSIYVSKANTYIKLHKSASSNILGVPGFFSRVKEKGKTIKEGWGFLSTGMDVHSAMMDLEKRQAAGSLEEDEQREIEQALSGQMLLVTWKGTQFELSSVLRQVVKLVLTKDKGVSSAILMRRARAILLLGNLFKQAKAEAADDERRELENMVRRAAEDRKAAKHKRKQSAKEPKEALNEAAKETTKESD